MSEAGCLALVFVVFMIVQVDGKKSRGNLECWDGVFTFESCCSLHYGPLGNSECWAAEFYTYENCCREDKTLATVMAWYSRVDLDESWAHGGRSPHSRSLLDLLHRADGNDGAIAKLSECERKWRFSTSVHGAGGIFAQLSGLPVVTAGWEGRADGDALRCVKIGGHFFLITTEYSSLGGSGRNRHGASSFGLCAPSECSPVQVASDLVPFYVLPIWDALGIPATLESVVAAGWPHLREVAHDHDVSALLDSPERLSMEEQRWALVVFFIKVLSSSVCIIASLALMVQRHRPASLLHVFSLRNAASELLQDVWPQGAVKCSERHRSGAADLLRSVATYGVIVAHAFRSCASHSHRQMSPAAEQMATVILDSVSCRSVEVFSVLNVVLNGTGMLRIIETHECYRCCASKLLRKLGRQVPLMLLTTAWCRYGDRYAFVSRPLAHVDGTLGMLEVQGDHLQFAWRQQEGTCKLSLFECGFLLLGSVEHWQIRDEMEIFIFLCSFALLRTCTGRCLANVLLGAALIFYLGEVPLSSRIVQLPQWTYRALVRFGWIGMVLAVQCFISSFLRRCFLMRPVFAVLMSASGWLLTAWLNVGVAPSQGRKAGIQNFPLVFGTCLLLESGRLAGSSDRSDTASETNIFAHGPWRFLSRISLCLLVSHYPLMHFIDRVWNEGQSLVTRCENRDPLLHTALISPGLMLWLMLLSSVLYILVQRPVQIFIEWIGRYAQSLISEVLLHIALLVYVVYFITADVGRSTT